MLFSKRDIDILRLLCWCQYIVPKDLSRVFSDSELKSLIHFGFVGTHKTSGSLILTGKGHSLLNDLFPGFLPNITQSYHKDAILRRQRISRLVLTAYQAGIHVFTTEMQELSDRPSLFLSSVTRERGHNPWGSARVAGIARLSDSVCAMHYVCPGIDNISVLDELKTLNNQAAQFKHIPRSLMFVGETYEGVLSELENGSAKAKSKLQTYGEAYRSITLPVHLLSCDETGAAQLQIMVVPDYRRNFTCLILQDAYCPAPLEISEWDAMYDGLPFVMAADMNLRRVDAAIEKAKKHGYPKIAIAALEGQVDAVFLHRYWDTGKARVFSITALALNKLLQASSSPYPIQQEPFVTPDGDAVDLAWVLKGC